MENICRTIYGAYLQSVLLTGRDFVVAPSSTLNEKFGVQASVLPDAASRPYLGFWGIGNMGHRMVTGAGGRSKPEPIQHRATDAACFGHIPFVLREPGNDLSTAERTRYAMRRDETHNGVRYIAYYLRRIDYTGVTTAMEYKTVTGGVTTTTPFVPDASNLEPQPPTLSSSGVNVTTGDYVTATSKVTLSLTVADVEELLSVARILYDDDGLAIISEICLVSGVDKVVASPSTGSTTINFKDVIAAQVVSHINAFYALKFANKGTDLTLDIGCSEPLFALA